MAVIYQADITPTKLEILERWAPTQPWWNGSTGALAVLGAYRFDDPAGDVGIETHLLNIGDDVLQVPLTYRGAPLPGAEAALIATMEHSVLGSRWVYDGCFDPVYAQVLATTIVTGGAEAALEVTTDYGVTVREPTVRVTGSGRADAAVPALDGFRVTSDASSSRIEAGPLTLVVRRRIDGAPFVPAAEVLTGRWAAGDSSAEQAPAVLAWAERS